MKSKSLNSLLSATVSHASRTSVILFISSLAASAADFTWDGGGVDNKATTPANWVGDIAPTGGAKTYEWNATSTGSAIDWDFSSGTNPNSFTFAAGSPAYTFTGNNIQFIGATTSLANNSSNTQTLSNNIQVFFNSAKTFDASTAGFALGSVGFRGDGLVSGNTNTLNLTGAFNGTISGAMNEVSIPTGARSALTKNGTGTWTLSGVNTFNGAVTVSAGTLKAGVASNPGVSGAFGLNTAVSTANVATAVLDLDGFDTQIGSLAGGGATGGNVTLGSATLTTGGNNTNTSYAGVISGGGALTKIGSGVQTLSGANLYGGGTAINAGSLSFLNTSAKPASGTVTVAAGATIILGVAAASPQFLLTDVDSLFAGTLPGVTNDIASSVGLDTSAGSITYATSTPANTRGLTKLGGNVLTLSGTNLHTGATTLSAGTLSVGTTENLGNANPLIFDGGNLQITGTALTSYASGAISGHPVSIVSGKTAGFDINDATNIFTVSEILNQGSGGLLKAGAGTLKLTGANSFTGIVSLNAGSLVATDPAALGTSRVVFASGTTKLSLLIDGGGTISLPNSIGSSSGFSTTIDVNNNGTGTNGVIQLNGSSGNSAIGTGTFNVTGGNGYSLFIANLRSTAGTPGAINFTPTTATLTLGNLTGSQASALSNVWTLLGSNTGNAVTGTISNGGSGGLTSAVQKSGTSTWTLSGANTYTGKSQVLNGTLIVSSLNSVVGGSANSNLGAPVTVALGTIDIGSAGSTGNLNYNGTGETTDRVINLAGSTGGTVITQAGSGNLKFTSDFTATGIRSKTLTLNGSTAGTGEIAGSIVNNTTGQTQNTVAYAIGATTMTLSSVQGIVVGATITGTGIPAATTITAINTTTSVVTLSAATTAAGATFQILTIPGVINPTSVTKNGTGAWTLSGAPTYTGTTTVQNGTLTLSGNRAVNSGGITIGGTADSPTLNIQNGTFALGGSFVIGQSGNTAVVNHSAGTITVNAGSRVLLGNGNSTTTYNLSGGTLISDGPGIRMGVNPATVANNNTFVLSGTGQLTSSLQIGRTDAAGSTNTTNLFSQTGGIATLTSLGMGGAAADAALTANVVATLNLTGGTFAATNFSSLSAAGGVTSAITIGGTAQVTLPAFPTGRAVSPVALGTGSTATITFDGGTLLPAATDAAYMSGLTSAFLTANGAKIDTNGFDIAIDQILQNAPSQTGTLTKSGTGTLTLTGANTYTGNTTVVDGTLSLGSTYLADTSTLTIGTVAASPAILNLPNAGTDTVASLVIDGVPQSTGLYDSTNSGGAITGLGKIQVGAGSDPFATWIDSPAFNTPPLSAGQKLPTADPDNDGISNLLEFVLNGNPVVSSQAILPTLATVGVESDPELQAQ